jgi:hypothetical protein
MAGDLTYYDVLEVPELASDEEIKSAYRRLAKEYHTDGLPDNRARLRAEAEERLKEINEAHDVLKTPNLRARYDAKLRARRAAASRPAPNVRAASASANAPGAPQPSSPPHGTAGPAPGPARPTPSSTRPDNFVPLLLLLGLVVTLGFESVRRGWIFSANGAATVSAAPEQIADRGVCPYEGCIYGERWRAMRNVDVYSAPPNAVGAQLASLSRQGTIRAGTWVKTETGLVLARRQKGHVRVESGRSPYGAAVTNGPPLKNGQTIPIYSYLGEGCWTSWIDGRFLPLCDVTTDAQRQNEWWVQLKTPTGSQVWTKAGSENGFVSEAGLNSELGEKISDDKLAASTKLSQVDALLKRGADLNGSGGKYGTDPLEAAIRSNDTVLLKELMSRGLNVRGSQPCPAFHITQGNALRAGGDLMLEFLLDNGMRLDCLPEPPLHALLRFGIGTETYPIDQAIRVAEVLVKRGANVNQRDGQGKSIFDLLDQAPNAARVMPLRDALNKGGADSGALVAAGLPAFEARPETPDQLSLEGILARADTAIRAGDYDRALADAERAVRQNPTDNRARALLERVRRIRSILK